MNTERTGGNWRASEPKVSESNGQTYFSIQSDSGKIRQFKNGENTYENVGFYYPISYQTPEEMKANADFICKSANAHDKLIKQLSDLREFSEVALSHIKIWSSSGNKNPELEDGLRKHLDKTQQLLNSLNQPQP